MRWYDYLACFWFADNISAGIINMNFLLLTMGALSYIFYEDFRKGLENANDDS